MWLLALNLSYFLHFKQKGNKQVKMWKFYLHLGYGIMLHINEYFTIKYNVYTATDIGFFSTGFCDPESIKTVGRYIWSCSSSGSSPSSISSYLIGLILLQVLDQIWALQMLRVRMKRAMATLVRRSKVLKLESKDLMKEKTIMKNWRRATDMITKLIAVAWTFLLILLLA